MQAFLSVFMAAPRPRCFQCTSESPGINHPAKLRSSVLDPSGSGWTRPGPELDPSWTRQIRVRIRPGPGMVFWSGSGNNNYYNDIHANRSGWFRVVSGLVSKSVGLVAGGHVLNNCDPEAPPGLAFCPPPQIYVFLGKQLYQVLPDLS